MSVPESGSIQTIAEKNLLVAKRVDVRSSTDKKVMGCWECFKAKLMMFIEWITCGLWNRKSSVTADHDPIVTQTKLPEKSANLMESHPELALKDVSDPQSLKIDKGFCFTIKDINVLKDLFNRCKLAPNFLFPSDLNDVHKEATRLCEIAENDIEELKTKHSNADPATFYEKLDPKEADKLLLNIWILKLKDAINEITICTPSSRSKKIAYQRAIMFLSVQVENLKQKKSLNSLDLSGLTEETVANCSWFLGADGKTRILPLTLEEHSASQQTEKTK